MDAKNRCRKGTFRTLVDGGKARRRDEEDRINQMDHVANLAFVTTKGSLGDTIADLTT